MEKFEKLKKFRDLDSLKLINKDKSTIKLVDKFKDLQEICNFFKGNGKWIYLPTKKIYLVYSARLIATDYIDSSNQNIINENLSKNSNYIDLLFTLPFRKTLIELNEIGFLRSGYWRDKDNWGGIAGSTAGYYSLGVYYLDEFFDTLDIRNQSFKLETNIIEEIDKKIKSNGIEIDRFMDINLFIKNLSEIGVFNKIKADNLLAKMQKNNNEVNTKELLERYKATLLENQRLKGFEAILNYNLLDKNIIKEEENQIKFRNLVNLYKTYKDYISCMYIKDDTEDTVELIFNADKIISSAENRDELFNGIEILYKKNKLGITKEEIYNDKNIFYFENGDIEIIYNPKSEEKISMYYFKNGDEEKRIYKNGILDGESTINFKDGSSEIREYKKGILQGEAIFKKDNQVKKYYYTDGLREEMPVLKYYLSIDKERINIDDYDEERLWDINLGHWDLKEEDKEELKEILGKKVYERDPKEDVHQGGIVGIDFGTKSTVVVYQKDKTTIMPMRISGGKLNKKVEDTDYENPTVIEFRNVENFLEKYNEKDGRPNTRWEDVMVSHTAFGNLTNGPSEYFTSIISDIKQWTTKEKEKHYLKDRTGSEYTLAPYLKLDENDENYIDPVELYAYYIGSYINTMTNGIYLEYLLSFPVTYEKAIREKILKSFEKGIKKSLPIQIQEDEKLMKKFKVKHGANEPAAYAACALKNFKIEPKDKDDKVYYGVFDFGGGTTDFDFGIWKLAEDEDMYDYELEHFGAGGDKYLGGENIIKELAYKVFTENSDTLLKKRIQYIRPEGYDELKGEGALVNNDSSIAKLNTRILGEILRGVWENSTTEDMKVIKPLFLYDTSGEKRGIEKNDVIELNVLEEELKNLIREKIDKGINNFFIKLEDAFKDEDAKEINIFLAGNSCKHPFVNEIFAEYQEKMKDKIKLNLYDLKAIEGLKEKDSTKVMPTGKTGVAYGLIYSRKGGRIKVTNRDEKENMANEVNFKFYIGNNKRDLFNTVLSPNSKYGKFEYFGKVTSDTFEIYYTTLPEAQTGKMEIDKTNVKRISLNEEYDEDEEYRIYIKATKPTKISYAIVKKEEGVDTKEFLEEGEIDLD
ncbi:hypothetical protein KST15_01500 [Fusobacterium polymorphum]|uniref:hypothetical protein n=1 Tax=Fusobacterium nucleatum subsp. polymorphum TaxID=76857 RepID=UPI0030D2C404